MKQRVGIARALANDPEVLLMDEPLAALDAQTRTIMQEELLRIWSTLGKTVIYVTHSLEEALLLGDRVVLLTARPGRVSQVFPVALGRPRGLEVRASPEYGALLEKIWSHLREEVVRAMAEEREAVTCGAAPAGWPSTGSRWARPSRCWSAWEWASAVGASAGGVLPAAVDDSRPPPPARRRWHALASRLGHPVAHRLGLRPRRRPRGRRWGWLWGSGGACARDSIRSSR